MSFGVYADCDRCGERFYTWGSIQRYLRPVEVDGEEELWCDRHSWDRARRWWGNEFEERKGAIKA